MAVSQALINNVIFRPPNSGFNGYFILHKSMFIVDGFNVPFSGRCDNLSYSVELPTWGTPYEDEGIYLGATSPYTGHLFTTEDVIDFSTFLHAHPDFCFTAIIYGNNTFDANYQDVEAIENGVYPAKLWWGKSLGELLKNIREWSFMVDEPFNIDHPMATLSKTVIEKLEFPDWVLEEIDSYPDMHLAKFLKNDENHRETDDNFPTMSEEIKTWFLEKVNQFSPKTTAQYLEEIII